MKHNALPSNHNILPFSASIGPSIPNVSARYANCGNGESEQSPIINPFSFTFAIFSFSIAMSPKRYIHQLTHQKTRSHSHLKISSFSEDEAKQVFLKFPLFLSHFPKRIHIVHEPHRNLTHRCMHIHTIHIIHIYLKLRINMLQVLVHQFFLNFLKIQDLLKHALKTPFQCPLEFQLLLQD